MNYIIVRFETFFVVKNKSLSGFGYNKRSTAWKVDSFDLLVLGYSRTVRPVTVNGLKSWGLGESLVICLAIFGLPPKELET